MGKEGVAITKIFKLTVLIILVFLLLIILYFSLKQSDITMLQAVSEDVSHNSFQYVYKDYSDHILSYGEKAAIDEETSTIYVSVGMYNLNNDDFLNGLLELSGYNGADFFVYKKNISESISKNEPLCVVISEKNKQEYMKYDLVLTTLPLININSEVIGEDKNGRPLSRGDFTIWSDEELSTQTSSVLWHTRGESSRRYDKKSYKLSLERHNEDNDMEFLGLGRDDEWILNGMVIDDTKVRECLLMDIWAQMQNISTYNIQMSSGRYIELVINGEYKGLYLLQREINEKYLELDYNSSLLRGTDDTWIRIPEIPEEAYGIEYTNATSPSNMYERMRGLFYMNDFSYVDMDNWIDVDLFIQFGKLVDNIWLKNSYYIWDAKKEKVYVLLWDTDQAFGVEWIEAGITYQFAPSVDTVREEHTAVLSLVPNISYLMSQRWEQLRSEIFNYDNLLSMAEKYNSLIYDSGAIYRDKHINGLFHNGKDSYENLTLFIQEQLKLMDEIYLTDK